MHGALREWNRFPDRGRRGSITHRVWTELEKSIFEVFFGCEEVFGLHFLSKLFGALRPDEGILCLSSYRIQCVYLVGSAAISVNRSYVTGIIAESSEVESADAIQGVHLNGSTIRADDIGVFGLCHNEKIADARG